MIEEWLNQITEELAAWNQDNPDKPAAPFAVNQIVHKSNHRPDQDMATCAKWKVPIVITSLGAIEDLNTAVKGWGGITRHDIINNRLAHKAIEKDATGTHSRGSRRWRPCRHAFSLRPDAGNPRMV